MASAVPSTRKNSIARALLVVLLVSAAGYAYTIGTHREAGAPLRPAPTADNAGAPPTTFSPPAPARRLAAARPQLLVRNAWSGSPIAAAKVLVIDDPHARVVDLAAAELAETDDQGTAEMCATAVGTSLLCVHPEFTSQAFTWTGDDTVLDLAAAHTLTVHCVDRTGNPVPRCRVFVSTVPLARPDFSAKRAVANPLVPAPAWSAESNETGVTDLRSLPPGDYYVYAIHPYLFPRAQDAGRSVSVPCSPITITMHEVHAAVVAALPERRIAGIRWIYDKAALGAWNRLPGSAGVTARLEARFPNCEVFVGAPNNPFQPVKITANAILDDGQPASLTWEMQPIEHILEPAVLANEQPELSGMATIRIYNGPHGGVEIRDIPIEVEMHGPRRGFKIVVKSGAAQGLPYGHYKMYADGFMPGFSALLDDKEFDVGDERETFDFYLPQPAKRVVVQASFSHHQHDLPIHMTIATPSGGFGIANWFPDRGDVVLWLETGTHEIGVSASGCMPRTERLQVDATATTPAEHVVQLTLVPAQ